MSQKSEIIFYNGERFDVPDWAEHISLNPDGSYVVISGWPVRNSSGFWASADGTWEYILPLSQDARIMRIKRKSQTEE